MTPCEGPRPDATVAAATTGAMMSGMADSTLIDVPSEPMVWNGWGDPAQRHGLPPLAQRMLAARFGSLPTTPPVAFEDVRLPEAALPDQARARLEAAVGPVHVRDDRMTRVLHAGGKSYPDLLRRRTGDAEDAPTRSCTRPRTTRSAW